MVGQFDITCLAQIQLAPWPAARHKAGLGSLTSLDLLEMNGSQGSAFDMGLIENLRPRMLLGSHDTGKTV